MVLQISVVFSSSTKYVRATGLLPHDDVSKSIQPSLSHHSEMSKGNRASDTNQGKQKGNMVKPYWNVCRIIVGMNCECDPFSDDEVRSDADGSAVTAGIYAVNMY